MRPHILVVLLSTVACPAWAQAPVVSSQILEPTPEDVASTPEHSDLEFGAAVSISGKTAMIGMPSHNGHRGRVGVYARTAEGWHRTATLTASNASDWAFGQRIDLDGNVAAIAVDAAAYLFARHEQQWREISRIPVGDPEQIGLTSVAYDRGVLALGINEFTDEGSLPGRVDLYESDPKGGVRRIATLRAGDGLPGDGFGSSLAMDGRTLVVGAPPAAYVFVRRGQSWVQQQKLMGSDASPSSAFAIAAAVRKGAILIGAPYQDLPGEEHTNSPEGNGYVFLQHRDSWFESQALNSDGRFFALFGENVAMGRGLVAVTTPIFEAVMSTQGSVLAFDWVGQELRFGREVAHIPERWRAVDLDFSERRLIVGMLEYSFLVENVIGQVSILEFGNE